MGEFSKHILADFAEFECERQLFLNMGASDPEWIQPLEKITPLQRHRKGTSMAAATLGKEYEQSIYRQLSSLPNAVYNRSPRGNIAESKLNPQILDSLNIQDTEIVLLEQSYPMVKDFLHTIFQVSDHTVMKESQTLRPDILLIGKNTGECTEILEDGSICTVNDDRYFINVVDIKVSNEENVGKKHFIEILFYLQTLASYLVHNNLQHKYFVRAENNGILPNIVDAQLHSIEFLRSHIVEVRWKETIRLYQDAIERIRNLTHKRPITITTTACKLQPACGRCNYLDDCKIRLGMNTSNPENWDLQLLPYLSSASAQQLQEAGFHTIGDVASKIDSLEITDYPQPIYAEIPLLKLKAQALVYNKVMQPSTGELTSVTIPKYTDIALVVNAEADPVHERVFAFSINYLLIVSEKSKYAPHFKELLSYCAQCAEGEISAAEVVQQFNSMYEVSVNDVKSISKSIRELLNDSTVTVTMLHKGDLTSEGHPAKNSIFKVEYAYVSSDLYETQEQYLAKKLLIMLHRLIRLSVLIEKNVYYEYTYIDKKGKSQIGRSHPRFSIFYWSHEILEALEQLLQRHMLIFLTDNELRPKFNYLISWLNPSEDMVKNDKQMSKVYDLRLFAETTQGFPLVLNYSWHEIYHHYTNFMVSMNYWTPHFNYMDFNAWYDYIGEPDSSRQSQQHAQLVNQLLFKVYALNYLRQKFQSSAKNLISKSSYPVESAEMNKPKLPRNYHLLASIWYLFSKLTGTLQQIDADNFRRMFPEFSIGKLMAAKVGAITLEKFTGKRGGISYKYRFSIHGLSTNMKLKEHDQVLFIPYELRDEKLNYWKLTIESILWHDEDSSFHIVTEKANKNYLEQFKERTGQTKSKQWYIYPSANDYWSDKLQKMLSRKNLGTSWLASNMLYEMGLQFDPPEKTPPSIFELEEVYMYLPEILNSLSKEVVDSSIITPVEYAPDDSQRIAILHSLQKVISIIQGPPGTGKSQTIATLVNELIARAHAPIRILITSFSYQALNVLLDKLNSLRHTGVQPSHASIIQKVYLKSANSDDVNGANVLIHTSSRSWKLDGKTGICTKKSFLLDHLDDSFVMFANPHQLHHLNMYTREDARWCFPEDFGFDVIICDEASQMPVDQFLAPLLFIHPAQVELDVSNNQWIRPPERLTKVILVGDHNQLPPVQPVKPPKKLSPVLGSIFSYYFEYHSIPSEQLKINYRSHQTIVEYTKLLGMYKDLQASPSSADRLLIGSTDMLTNWTREVMHPQHVVGALIHTTIFDTAVSKLEAELVRDLVIAYYRMVDPQSKDAEFSFWTSGIGIVAPHNAHGRLIIQLIFSYLTTQKLTQLSNNELMSSLRGTIFSVEKFQGSDRDFIIASIGISSIDQLSAEEEFIYELNRFNVLTSRAKSKILLVASENFLKYFPRDRNVMASAAKIREFAMDFCTHQTSINVYGQLLSYRYY